MRDLLTNALTDEGISAEPLQAAMASSVAATQGSEGAAGRSDTASDSAASQLSSALGAWGDDPQIQEKVR